MFTLCGLILEARENLFQNFWSPFSISFIFFLHGIILKKCEPTLGRNRLGLRQARALNSRAPGRLSQPSRAAPRAQTLAAASPPEFAADKVEPPFF